MHCTQSLADLGHVPLQGHPFSRPHMEESVQHQTQSRGKLQPLIPGLRVHPGPFLGTVPLYIYRTFYCSSQGAFRIKRLRPKHQQSSSSFLVSVFTFFLGGVSAELVLTTSTPGPNTHFHATSARFVAARTQAKLRNAVQRQFASLLSDQLQFICFLGRRPRN